MKLIQSFSSCEIDGQRWHEGLEGTKQIEHQVDFVISHPSNVEDVIFISTFLIIKFFCQQSAPPLPAALIFYCLCGSNYQARSTDMNCYIIYISVTTMHPPNLEFWQMVFLFEMFFISSTLYPKLIFHHPVILGCCCCAGDEMNVGFHLKPINKWIELNKIK